MRSAVCEKDQRLQANAWTPTGHDPGLDLSDVKLPLLDGAVSGSASALKLKARLTPFAYNSSLAESNFVCAESQRLSERHAAGDRGLPDSLTISCSVYAFCTLTTRLLPAPQPLRTSPSVAAGICNACRCLRSLRRSCDGPPGYNACVDQRRW